MWAALWEFAPDIIQQNSRFLTNMVKLLDHIAKWLILGPFPLTKPGVTGAQYMYEQTSPLSLTTSVAFSSGAQLTGDWEHHCELIISSLKAYQNAAEATEATIMWLLSQICGCWAINLTNSAVWAFFLSWTEHNSLNMQTNWTYTEVKNQCRTTWLYEGCNEFT